jgi:hypothetical protein
MFADLTEGVLSMRLPAPLLVQSKVELQPELNHARIARGRDRAERRISDHSVRVPERRRVRQIEYLRAEFELSVTRP